MQHILLGINAHINLDLGLAAGLTSPGDSIHDLEKDFREINVLLNEKINEVQAALNRLSPIWKILDFLGAKQDEFLASFSIKSARKQAWKVACQSAYLKGDQLEDFILATDRETHFMGRLIAQPPSILIRVFIWAMSRLERNHPKEVLELLENHSA